ncbi:MAG: RNA methyltransferase, partial [Myxococcota bacterium]|nr:RNA methyltransferase [Myxococcota bacterium]
MSDAPPSGMSVHVALVHHPVRNRHGETVATAVTNLDIHDLARSGRTFDVAWTWIVSPLEQQRSLVARIVNHWQAGEGKTFNPIRARAFERVRVTDSIEALIETIASETGDPPVVVGTGAGLVDDVLSYRACREQIATGTGSLLLLFGTGWGLVDEVMERCDHRLPGITAVEGRDGYNHLS